MTIVEKAQQYVEKLLKPLEWLDYHRYSHTLEVFERSLYLAWKEWASNEIKEIIALGAIFHDTGFIVSYDDNEHYGAKIARNFLIWHSYPEEKLSQIESIILATKHDYLEPQNLSEQIIKDADMDNLGRDDFLEKMSHIKTERELAENQKISEQEWILRCINMLETFSFFTKTQQQERNPTKEKNLTILLKNI